MKDVFICSKMQFLFNKALLSYKRQLYCKELIIVTQLDNDDA